MNPRPNEQPDADALDAFWDELVLGQNVSEASTPDEEMVLTLQNTLALVDSNAESRLRGLVFGSAPPAAAVAAPVQALPKPKPEPIRPSWSIRKYTQWAAAALAVILVGALVAAQNSSFFGSGGEDDTPTAIPAAIAQLEATPAMLASPTVSSDAVLWTLPFNGTNVEVGATALADGTLYRLIRSDEFTGVQAVIAETGIEKWRSEHGWTGHGLAAGSGGVAFLTGTGPVSLAAATGEERWTTGPLESTPVSISQTGSTIFVWDGVSFMTALDAETGDIDWVSSAGLTLPADVTPATLPPVGTSSGVAGVSATSMITFFDSAGNATGSLGEFDPATVDIEAAPDGMVAIAGAIRTEDERTWARKLMLAMPGDGQFIWQTDYNALVTGLTLTDSMAFVLADNPGLAVGEVELVDLGGTVTTEETNPYPEQTSPQIYGYDLETGQMHVDRDESTGTGHGWVSDAGSSSYIAITTGPQGPIAISESGQLSFFSTENPMVQAVITLSDPLPNQIMADASAVFVSLENGAVTAVAPQFTGAEPQPYGDSTIDWALPLDGQLTDFGGMAYGNGLVFRLIETSDSRGIQATYAATGQPAWTLAFDWSIDQIVTDQGQTDFHPNQALSSSGNIFVVDAENRLIGLNGASGQLSWQHAFAEPVVSMIYDADALYVWDESGTMTAFADADGTVQWEAATGQTGSQSNDLGMPVPALTSELIAMIDTAGTLHAFDRSSGEIVWSTPGFNGTNTRIVRQGNAEWDQTEVFVVVSARGEAQADGSFEQTVSGVLAATGERIWDNAMQGPLVQPVNTDETLVVVTADQLLTGKNVPTNSTPVVDAESFNHYVWSGTGETAPDGGGERLFALQADTGEIVWIRTTAAGGFNELFTKFPFGSGTLYAVTSDGLLVSPNRGDGAIDGAPTPLGGPVLATIPSGETGAIGSFATLSDGTLVAVGGTPFSQQG